MLQENHYYYLTEPGKSFEWFVIHLPTTNAAMIFQDLIHVHCQA